MERKVLAAGFLGGVVMMVVAFVANGVFGLNARLELNPVPHESLVYATLRASVVEPGGYVCNPPLTPDHTFPANEPVYRIRYAGVGHEAAARAEWLRIMITFVAATLAAWLLSKAPGGVPAKFGARLGFFVGVGVLIAAFADLSLYDIGGLPWGSAVTRAVFDIFLWACSGAAMAWVLKPRPQAG